MASKSIKWDITSKCNLHCTHCSVGKEYFDSHLCEIPISLKLEIIDKLADGGVGYISLLGGEPLTLGNGLLEIIQRAVRKGIKVSIVTNGMLLEKPLMKALVASGIDRIVISLEGGSKETHEAVRGKNTFEKLLSNICNLKKHIDEINSSVTVGINTVLNKKNMFEIEKIFDLLVSLDVSEWTLLSLGDVGYAEDNISTLGINVHEEIDIALRVAKLYNNNSSKLSINPLFTYPLVWDYIEKKFGLKINKTRICCTASISLGFVSPDGYLYPCDRISKEYFVGSKILGEEIKPMSLLDYSFYDVWNSNYFVKMFNFILNDFTYKNYYPCNQCEYFKTRFCTPCPLYSINSKVLIKSCAIVEKEMGLSLEPLKSNYKIENLFGFEKVNQEFELKDQLKEEQMLQLIPTKKEGIRVFSSSESVLLLNPENIEYTSLNLMGKAIWDLIDGKKPIAQINHEISDILNIVFKGDQKRAVEINKHITQRICAFINVLERLKLIRLYDGNFANR